MGINVAIDKMTREDWEAVQSIYAEGIATGNATFESEVPTFESWDQNHLQMCRLVVRSGDDIVGWAALSQVSQRHVYRGVAEVSIYIAASARGLGMGKTLLQALIAESESFGIWTLQAGIFPENIVSIAMHQTCGFREVGRYERLGQMNNGNWRDVILLERRSKVAGV
jgi:phosphinothricin acetyltransferase